MTLAEAGQIVGAVVAIGGVLDFVIRKYIEKASNQTIHDLSAKLQKTCEDLVAADDERDRAVAKLDESEAARKDTAKDLGAAVRRLNELKATTECQAAELAELRDTKAALDKSQKAHDNRINRALRLQGAIWTQGVMKNPPPFVPRTERKTPIVSVLNLKGGVGKTTLTANLAWALSARGYRVLLVDLDLQGSLSSLFLHNEELARLGRDEKRLFQHFLAPEKPKEGLPAPPRRLLNFAVPVPQLNPGCRLIAASDRLAYAELSQTVRWLLRVGGRSKTWSGRHDGRMILRKALHKKALYNRFDVVLMDCPPLINLCCSNALAASDAVLIPVTPSPKAIERVPPLLRRVVEVRQNGVNPELNVLGVVVNRTERVPLTPREEDLFVNLPDECQKVFGSPVDRFDTLVQRRVAIQDSEDQFVAPEEGSPLRKNFESLAQEFISRTALGEPRRPARRKKSGAPAPGGSS